MESDYDGKFFPLLNMHGQQIGNVYYWGEHPLELPSAADVGEQMPGRPRDMDLGVGAIGLGDKTK